MKKIIKYSFATCTLAYFFATILIFILFVTIYSGLTVDNRGMLSFLTLMLSDFPWWGNVYYLAFLIPWLASCGILAVLIRNFNGEAKKRKLFSGLTIFIYYFAMLLVFIIHGLIYGWGDVAYDLIWLWPLGGFGFGVAAAILVERVSNPQFNN